MIKILINNLKKRKLRLVIIILLFAFSLSILGLGISASEVNMTKLSSATLNDIEIKSASISLGDGRKYKATVLDNKFITENEIGIIESQLLTDTLELYNPYYSKLLFTDFNQVPNEHENGYATFYCENYFSYTSLDKVNLNDYGLSILEGRLPTAIDEVAIPHYAYLSYEKFGIRSNYMQNFASPKDIIGEKILWENTAMKIVGVIDTGLNYDNYKMLKTPLSDVKDYQLEKYISNKNYLSLEVNNGLHTTLFVSDRFLNYAQVSYKYTIEQKNTNNSYLMFGTATSLNNIGGVKLINNKTELNVNEVVLSKFEAARYNLVGVNGADNTIFTYEYNKNPPSDDEVLKMLEDNNLKISIAIGNNGELKEYNIVGISPTEEIILANEVINDFWLNPNEFIKSVVIPFSKDSNLIKKASSLMYDYKLEGEYRFQLNTVILNNLQSIEDTKDATKMTGIIIGVVFSIFSCVLILLFFSISIKDNKKDLGILMSLGVNKSKLISTYFLETLMVAIFSSILAIILLAVISPIVSSFFMKSIYKLAIVKITFLSSLSIVGIGIFTALIGSILPILSITKHKPIEIIRNK